MRIALLVPPILRPDGSCSPVPCAFPGWGIALVGASLRTRGYDVSVVDCSADDEAGLRVRLPDLRVDVVGLAVFSEAAGGAERVLELLAEAHPALPVIVGGPHPTWVFEPWLRHPNVAAVIRGEAEDAIIPVVEAIAAGSKPSPATGVVVRSADGVSNGGSAVASGPPDPARIHLSDVSFRIGDYGARLHPDSDTRQRRWIEAGGGPAALATAVHTTRGCMFRCRFCSFEVPEGLRTLPMEWVYEVLSRVHARGVRNLIFYDAVFLARPDRVVALAEEMIRRDWGFRWTAQTIARHRENTLELIPLLARAGMVSMAIGLESASPEIRKSMAKDKMVVPISEVLAAYRSAGVQAFVNVMLGAPAEDDASVEETCKLLHAVPPEDVGGAKRLRLYPGSSWHGLGIERGLVDADHDWRTGVPTGVFHSNEQQERWETRIARHRELSDSLSGLRAHQGWVRVGHPPHPDVAAVEHALSWRLGAGLGDRPPSGPFPCGCAVLVYQQQVLPAVRSALGEGSESQIVYAGLVGSRYVLRLEPPTDGPRVSDLYASWEALHTALCDQPVAAGGAIHALDRGLRGALDDIRPVLPVPPRPPPGPHHAVERLEDRILGAWLGRAAGNRLGVPCENLDAHQIREASASLGFTWDSYWPADPKPALGPASLHFRTTARRAFLADHVGIGADDDLAYTLLGLHILETAGPWPKAAQIAAAWLKHLPFACTAEHHALDRLRQGHAPASAADGSHPFTEWVGAMIRVDPWAWVHAGAPGDAAAVAWEDAALTHRGEGVHAAVFTAAMIAAAFAVDTPTAAIRAGVGFVPPGSGTALAVHAGLRAADRRDMGEALAWGAGLSTGHVLRNLPLIVAGLVLGDGDLGPTLVAVVRAGQDTDSNAATAGSVVGALRGASDLPRRWIAPLGDTIDSYLVGVPPVRSRELARRFVALTEQPGGSPCVSVS